MPVNHGFSYRARVEPAERGLTVLTLLATRWTHSDAATWAERLAAGEVELDGASASPDAHVRPGQRLVWHRPPWEEPAVPLRFTTLYEDEHLLAVDKPSGLPTMPAGGFLDHTLLSLVRRRHPDASPMHRLGRGTSGVVLFASSPAARAALQADWRAQRVEKTYRALAQGDLVAQTITVPIGPVVHPRLGVLHAASAAGRPATSHVRPIERRAGSTLAEVDIDTGRPHQIRVHLAAVGHPLLDDPLYGPGGLPRADALPGDEGYLLHAHRLTVRHPIAGGALRVEAPLPEALQARDGT